MNRRQFNFSRIFFRNAGIIIAFILLAGFFLIPTTFKRTPPFILSTISFIGKPIIGMRHTGDAFVQFFKTKKLLISENQSLRAQNTILQLRFYEKESARNISDSRFPIIFSPQSLFHDQLLIDTRDRNFFNGNEVLFEGVRIGTIKEIKNNYGVVQLIWAYGNVTGARISRISSNFSLEGIGAHVLRFTAPRDTDIITGDIVVEANAPHRFIGLVDTVNRTEEDAFQTIFVRSPINIHTLTSVDVVEQ